jgi:hypothetical protein
MFLRDGRLASPPSTRFVTRDALFQELHMFRLERSLAIVVMSLAAVAGTGAQQARQAGPPKWEPADEQTIKATIQDIRTVPGGPRGEMVYLTITRENAPFHIILGPESWVKKQSFTLAKGAAMEVVGMPGSHVNGEPAMRARTIKIGSKTLTVRNAEGTGLWEAGSTQR